MRCIRNGFRTISKCHSWCDNSPDRCLPHFHGRDIRFWYLVLVANSAHFGASTVRLYSKPGATGSLPFLSWGFPLVALVVLALCMCWPERLGSNLTSLYLTWSPFHYAAQTYGLSVMYSYRSGCLLGTGNKKLLWWVSCVSYRCSRWKHDFPTQFNYP